MSRIVVLLVSVLVGVVLAAPADAAAPRLILIHGGGLAEPVVLSDWWENLELLTTAKQGESVEPAALTGRPFFEVGFYWGPKWNEYVDRGGSLDRLDPEQAEVRGRLYPSASHGDVVLETVYDGEWGARRLPADALAILTRHGVPALVARAGASTSGRPSWPGLALGSAVAIGGVLVAFALIRQRRARMGQSANASSA